MQSSLSPNTKQAPGPSSVAMVFGIRGRDRQGNCGQFERAESGIPLVWQWQPVSLGGGFVAGVVGATALTAIVVWHTQAHLAVWMLIGFIVDGLLISQASPPIWSSVARLDGISFQALLGYRLAGHLFRPVEDKRLPANVPRRNH